MDSASLRIRFAPLLTNIQKSVDSKFCIEIVPEVSGFHNLDKLDLKIDDGLIKYTIPMTYKIVIKKQPALENKCVINKTYHSCVDLLQVNSISNVDMASGDVTRIISETFILSRVASDIENCDFIPNDDLVNLNRIYEIQDTVASTEAVSKHETSVSSRVALAKTFGIDIEKYETVVLTTNEVVNNVDFIQKNSKTQVREYENETHSVKDLHVGRLNNKLFKTKNNFKAKFYKPSLNLTPICSISTYNDCPNIKNLKSTAYVSKNRNNAYSFICAIHECKSDETLKSKLKYNGIDMAPSKPKVTTNELPNNLTYPSNACGKKSQDICTRATKIISNENLYSPNYIENKPNRNELGTTEVSICTTKMNENKTSDSSESAHYDNEHNPNKLNEHKIINMRNPCISTEDIHTENKCGRTKDDDKRVPNGIKYISIKTTECNTKRISYNHYPSKATENTSNQTEYELNNNIESVPVENKNGLDVQTSTRTKQSNVDECRIGKQSKQIEYGLIKGSKGTEYSLGKLPNENKCIFKKLSNENLFCFNKHLQGNERSPNKELRGYMSRQTNYRELRDNVSSSLNKRFYCNEISKETTLAICDDKEKIKRFKNRELPEVRISHFIQILENEFFPLRVIINEIQTKCVRFGIFFNITNQVTGQTAFVPNSFFLYKSRRSSEVRKSCSKFENCGYQTAMCKNITSQCDVNNESLNYIKNEKSNRVVYTVMFDG